MTSLGKYELHEQLGRGGFGTVYRAIDTSLGREVALKVLHPQLTTDPDFLERFRNEARLVAALDSPHIVTIHDLGEADGRVFIAMKYLPGGSLKQKLEKEGALPFDEVLKIMKQVCSGLNAAHKKGLVHRDIKPGNILFDAEGNAVIGDFGLARAIQQSSTSAASSTGGVGTPAYRAPELWIGKPPASPATDIYSLGCVLSEMLTGNVLFDGDSTDVVITQHLVVGPQIADNLTKGIQQILKCALTKNPDERYQTVTEFENAFNDPEIEKKIEEKKKDQASSTVESIVEPPPLEILKISEKQEGVKGVKEYQSEPRPKTKLGVWLGVGGGLAVILLLVIGGVSGWFGPKPVPTTTPTVASAALTQASVVIAEASIATEGAVAAEPVTITWWHITTKDPGLTEFQKMADDYMAAHPNVKIEITILENEAFKTKLTTVMQSGEVPDIFQSWGQGGMIEQVNAGLLKDISADLEGEWGDSLGALDAFAVDGKNYGVPWDMGAVTFWYNKDLFAQAGVEVPTTWSEFLAVCETLKAAGITPIAVGEGDKWPGMHIWAYLVSRIGGAEAFAAAADSSDARTGSFEDEAFVQAGYELKKLVDGGYFQEGFLGAVHDDQMAALGNGKAAMVLGGQWTASGQASNSADLKGVNLGMFNFPAVEGGAGLMTDVVGGGNGYAIGKDAEPEAIDFVKYLTNLDNQKIVASTNMGIPVAKGASESITDPNMVLVADAVANSTYYQLYFDQVLPSAMGSIINDAVQKIFAGTATPEEVAAEIEAGFKAQ